jgi:glycosyltransferase involved in cell wall biosynthesis
MRIAMVYDVIYPYVKGGAERRFYELARRLSPRHEIHLLGMQSWEGQSVIQNESGVFLHGVCAPKDLYAGNRRSIRQAVYYSQRLIGPLLQLAQRVDLIDCSSVPVFPVFVSKLCSVLRRKPLVSTWHEYWGDYWRTYLNSSWTGSIAQYLERAASRLPDRVVAVSDHTKAGLANHGVPKSKIEVVHCGIDLAGIEQTPMAKDGSDVIFAGRLIREKHVDLLLRAVHLLRASIPHIQCIIIGDGPERAGLERLRDALGLSSNVRFVGFLERHQDVFGLIKASRVFVLPSEREGFGMVVPEANACGLPVVVARAKHSAASSFVREGESGLVCDLDVQQIARAISKLLGDGETYQSMRRGALSWARQFDWDAAARRTEQIYCEMVA